MGRTRYKIFSPRSPEGSLVMIFEVTTPDKIKVFLDEGDEKRGFAHISLKHLNDFKEFFREVTDEKALTRFLEATLRAQPVVVFENERHYCFKGNAKGRVYVLIIVNANTGMIITAYPMADPSKIRSEGVHEARIAAMWEFNKELKPSSASPWDDEGDPETSLKRARLQHIILDYMGKPKEEAK
jgi:hypothetical protein